MSEFFEECINDVGLRFKRKKKELERKVSLIPTETKQQRIKQKEPPSKKPLLVDLKKSLAKFENLPKNSQNIEVVSENNNNKKTSEDLVLTKPSSYPKLPNKLKLNLNFDKINKEVFPQFRWPLLVKEIAGVELNRVEEVYKNNPGFLLKLREVKNHISEVCDSRISEGKKKINFQPKIVKNQQNSYNMHKNMLIKEMIKDYQYKVQNFEKTKEKLIENSKYKERKAAFGDIISSTGLLEVSEATSRLLDDDSSKILGLLYKNNQDRTNNILEAFKGIKQMNVDMEQLSEDIDKNLKYAGKEIFGNADSLLDMSCLFKKLKINSF